MTRADLKAYRARWREPLSLRLKNATLYNTPAPTQGLASLMMLGIYERLAPRGVDGFEHAHALIEGFKRAQPCATASASTSTSRPTTSPRCCRRTLLDAEAGAVSKTRASA